jgi:hypothetical protein
MEKTGLYKVYVFENKITKKSNLKSTKNTKSKIKI